MIPAVIYVVRRNGREEFKGSLAELKAWLAERRMTSADEVRRLGYVVLEGDDLWTLVGDRKELGFDVARERSRLRALQGVSRSLIGVFCILVLVGLYMLVVDQGIPRYDAQQAIHEIQANSQKILQAQHSEFESKIHDNLSRIGALESREKVLTQNVTNTAIELARAKTDLAVALAQLQAVSAEHGRARDELSKASDALDASQQGAMTLSKYPFVYDNITYGMRTREDFDCVSKMEEVLKTKRAELIVLQDRADTAQARSLDFLSKAQKAIGYNDRVIYQGLYSESFKEYTSRESERIKAADECFRLTDALSKYLREHAY